MKGKLKRPIAFLMTLALIFNMGFTAYAGAIPSNYDFNRHVEESTEGSGGTGDSPGDEQPTVYNAVYNMASYEIRYLLKGTNDKVPGLDTKTGSAEVGTEIDVPQPPIDGYKVLAEQILKFTINADESQNEYVVYYEAIEAKELVTPEALTAEVDGLTIAVTAEAGVIPEGTRLSAVILSEEEYEQYFTAIEEDRDIFINSGIAFDISLVDADGNEVQPDGEVTVSFSGMEAMDEEAEVAVFHVEPRKKLLKARALAVTGLRDGVSTEEVEINDMSSEVKDSKILFKTNHFSIYIVGTDITHSDSYDRYVMNIGDSIELEEKDLSAGGTWSIRDGSSRVALTNTSNTSGNIKATVTALAVGDARIRYKVSGDDSNSFYIRVVDPDKESYDTLTPATEPEEDPDELPPGTVAAQKAAKWVDYDNRIAEIELSVEGMPIISGSDVILVMDVSGSMGESYGNRIVTAREASIEFINELLGDSNPANNRVAFIPFEGNYGGAGATEVADTTRGSVNFSYDIDRLEAHVNATVAGGSTNYSAALQKAVNYAGSRPESERSRPLYIVFMSDGAPGPDGDQPYSKSWNGVDQANNLKGSSYNATIYTVGIQLGDTGTAALQAISSTAGGAALYTPVADMDDLAPVLATIAGEIKKAGTLATFTDYISQYFNFYDAAPYDNGDGIYNPTDKSVAITVGDILESAKTYKIYVQLKPEYRIVGDEYPTNSDITLDYTDVNDQAAEKNKAEIGDPEVSVGYGTIKIKYAIVNSSGDYIDGIGGVVVDEAYRVFVPTPDYYQDYEFNGSSQLDVERTYTVAASAPSGYSLYSGETSTKEQLLTTTNRNATVEFKVVASPKYTLTYAITGSLFSDPEYATQEYEAGAPVTAVSTPSQTGYTFNGWNDVPATMPASDATATGYYSALDLFVTYLPGEGDVTEETLDTQNPYVYNETVTVLSNSFKREGYHFTHWNADYDNYYKSTENKKNEAPAFRYGVYNPSDTFSMPSHNVYLTAQWALNEYTITYQAGPNGGFEGIEGGTRTDTKTYGEGYGTAPTPIPNTGYVFAGWTPELPDAEDTVTGEKTFTANFTPSTEIRYTVNYYKNGTTTSVADSKTVTGQTFGTTVTETAKSISGYNVDATTKTLKLDKVDGNVINFYYTVKNNNDKDDNKEVKNRDKETIIEEEIPLAAPELNKVDHYQYLQGYPDNTVRPEGKITREEVAAVFYRLLTADYRGSIMTTTENFSDVEAGKWSTIYIATLANGGILEGNPDGTFKPHDYITKGELAAVASRFDNLSPFEDDSFTDIAGHWANKYINSAAKKGWVKGNPNGTFEPNKHITRAEFATLVNNVLERRVHKANILKDAKKFPDLLESKWYYEAMMEAINSHYYTRMEDTYEEWSEIYYPDLDL